MNLNLVAVVQWFETHLQDVPIAVLDVWGQAAFIVGIILMICAYSGFTPQPGGKWGFGWQRGNWDSAAFYSILITFVLIITAGFAGSFIVLVPGAQTFESIKDLCVFICVLLFGYPALLAVPFAYGVADLVEGVPPEFLRDWLIGYFINASCFWIATVLFGKDPDFKKKITWKKYFLFVLIFSLIEPILWGYIAADKYTAEISYRNITPALFFTTSITWLMAPFAMLVALPIAKRLGLFWADIPLHSQEQRFGKREFIWTSGSVKRPLHAGREAGFPIRMVLIVPFFVLVLSLVSVTAYFTLKSSGNSAHQLALSLHDEITESVKVNLVGFLKDSPLSSSELNTKLDNLLKQNSLAGNGRSFIIDRNGKLIASSKRELSGDTAEKKFTAELKKNYNGLKNIRKADQFRMDIIKTKPLLKEGWLVQVAPFTGADNAVDWLIVTALPQHYYLQGIRTGTSQSALVFSAAIILVMLIVALLSKIVTQPIRKISEAAVLISEGHFDANVPGSKVQEINMLSTIFNKMSAKLKQTIDSLNIEIIKRIAREKELEETELLLKENENRLKTAVKAADLGIWDWEISSGKVIWDDAMFKQHGMKRAKPNWRFDDWVQHIVPEDREAFTAQVQKAIKDKRDYSAEYRVRWRDDSLHYLKVVGRTVFVSDGKAKCMIGVASDVTKLKTTELALIASRDEALEASKAKSEFLANMSHEIRTPLNTILGMNSVLGETPLTEEQKKCVAITSNSSEHLLHLINDIIDANIIESRGIILENASFDLYKVISSTVDFLTIAADRKGIKLSAKIDDAVSRYVVGDEHRLRQILINLVGNAVKFTEKGSVEISVEKDLQPLSPDTILFSVQDTGIGIAPEQKKIIFERFTQGNSSITRKHEGTGLGLSISKYLVELMGGKIKLESTLGEGSRFYFSIDLKPGTVSAEKPALTESLDLHELNVLIVDDSEDNRTLLKHYLSKSKCHMDFATNGVEAVDKFNSGHYDMIFMDIQMPGMDGYTATKKIRHLENVRHQKHTPIAALTAFALKEEVEKSYEAGFDLHITKPVKKDVILNALSQIQTSHTVDHSTFAPS